MMRPVRPTAALCLATTALVWSSAAAAQSREGDTVVALIDLLVARGTITRSEADALVARARTTARADAPASATGPKPQVTASAPQLAQATTPPAGPSRLRQESPGTPNPSAAAPSPAPEHLLVKAATDNALAVDWSEGAPKFASPGGFTFRPRARVLIDVQTATGSGFADRNITTTGARALRLGVEGTYGTNLFYQFEADFADAGTEVTSAYFGWRKKLSDDVTTELSVGSRLTERGIDGSTGSDQTPFMERNAIGVGLVPLKGFFGLGLTSKTFGPNWHITGIIVGEAINGASNSDDSWTAMTRGHWNPIKTDNGLVHLGGWYYHEGFSSSVTSLTLNTREANRYNDNIRVFAGALGSPESSDAFGLEAGGTLGGLWSFGEYGQRAIDFRVGAPSARVKLKAWSVSGGWVLTGEKAPFAPRGGTFTMLDVKNPVFTGGTGALELLARYEELDYSDAPQGGRGHAFTGGINWYLNDISRIMLNYIHYETRNRAGDYVGPDNGDLFATRFQISF